MDKKIIFLDLDGTLTNDEKQVTPKTKAAIWQMIDEGHLVALASGRPTPGVASVGEVLELKERGGYLLSYNGGRMTDCKTGEIQYEKTLNRSYVPEIMEYVKAHNLGVMTYDDRNIIVGNRMDSYIEVEHWINKMPLRYEDLSQGIDFDPVKVLVTADPAVAEEHELALAKLFEGRLTVYRSSPFFIEVLPMGIDKAAAIEKLIEKLGITRENTIACGDGFNDLSMIDYAGLGVAMANAEQVVKDRADYVTASNNEDGVAQVIEKFVLS